MPMADIVSALWPRSDTTARKPLAVADFEVSLDRILFVYVLISTMRRPGARQGSRRDVGRPNAHPAAHRGVRTSPPGRPGSRASHPWEPPHTVPHLTPTASS